MVPEPQRNHVLVRQARSTDFCRAFGLTSSRACHHPVRSPACRRTIEIQYVAAKRMLTSKFVFHKISISEMRPQNAFSVSCYFSQRASAVHERPLYLRTLNLKRRTKTPLTPQSSPRKRGEAVDLRARTRVPFFARLCRKSLCAI